MEKNQKDSRKRIDKLIESAERSGLSASLLNLDNGNSLYGDTELLASVVGAVSAGDIQLFDERDQEFLDTLDIHAFFDLQNFLCKLIPQLEVPHSELMRLVHALVVKAGNDLLRNQPYVALREWFAKDSVRSSTVVADVRRGEEMAKSHLCFALEAAGDAETAIAFLSEEHDAEILIGAITALGRIELTGEVVRDAAEVLSRVATDITRKWFESMLSFRFFRYSQGTLIWIGTMDKER